MDKWYSVAEEKIREAMDKGQFRNLRGQGRPLDLRRNPFEPPDLRLAHMVLEGAGLSPAWIEERKDLEADCAEALEALRGGRISEDEFRGAAAALNRRILTYNLKVPSGGFQRRQIDAEFEIARARRVT
jgi:hypothetical protein